MKHKKSFTGYTDSAIVELCGWVNASLQEKVSSEKDFLDLPMIFKNKAKGINEVKVKVTIEVIK